MTENLEKHCDRDKAKDQAGDNDDSPHAKDKEQHDRTKVVGQLKDVMALATSKSSPRGHSPSSSTVAACSGEPDWLSTALYSTTCTSFYSEILLLDIDDGDFRPYDDSHKDETFGTQRVYKKTSPNCVLTMYLPSREITLAGNNSSVLQGIVFVDPKAIQGYRVYAQLTLTFRYGREDEEVMGLRFCNEAIMSLHQVWPRNEEPSRESLSPLQDALVKRLGDGAHPFTLTLTPHAPPSVQLVPAKRYYGAPIGTSYDVRCFIADKTDEKFHRRASVKMGVRVIYRPDVFQTNGLDNLSTLINSSHNQQTASSSTTASPAMTTALMTPPPVNLTTTTSNVVGQLTAASTNNQTNQQKLPEPCTVSISTPLAAGASESSPTDLTSSGIKSRKSERGESFPKLRLSPKSFRFSGRFGRSKSEVERCPSDPFYNYSKSFQEYDSLGSGPQGAVDKPFLLQDGRVGLRASLDKAWYTHGEDVCVTVNVRNDSRKTVRKIRVCAIQHVDVCMFNNGKFKNVVADSDSSSPIDRVVPPGGVLNTTIILKPQRGPTKNWIALEDTLQRSTEPDEITGSIAASAIRSPLVLSSLQGGASNLNCSTVTHIRHQQQQCQPTAAPHRQQQADDRNVFAIYVSYYVKVKLTLSGMGGELSLKLPFILVHVDEQERQQCLQTALVPEETQKLPLDDVPAAAKRNFNSLAKRVSGEVSADDMEASRTKDFSSVRSDARLDRIESIDDDLNIKLTIPAAVATTATTTTTKTTTENVIAHSSQRVKSGSCNNKRRLKRSETLAEDCASGEDAVASKEELPRECSNTAMPAATTSTNRNDEVNSMTTSSIAVDGNVHVVQIHSTALAPQYHQPEVANKEPEVMTREC